MSDYDDAEIELLKEELDALVHANAAGIVNLGNAASVNTTELLIHELVKQIFPEPLEYLRFQIAVNIRLSEQIRLAEMAVRKMQTGQNGKLHVPGQ